jgi:hypothetical protein
VNAYVERAAVDRFLGELTEQDLDHVQSELEVGMKCN